MHFIIYNKTSGTIVQVRCDMSTGDPVPLSAYLQQHCELCELNLSEYAITEIAKPSVIVTPGKYKYIESTQQIEIDPNWVRPADPTPPEIPPPQ
jgi:hypothetical protein